MQGCAKNMTWLLKKGRFTGRPQVTRRREMESHSVISRESVLQGLMTLSYTALLMLEDSGGNIKSRLWECQLLYFPLRVHGLAIFIGAAIWMATAREHTEGSLTMAFSGQLVPLTKWVSWGSVNFHLQPSGIFAQCPPSSCIVIRVLPANPYRDFPHWSHSVTQSCISHVSCKKTTQKALSSDMPWVIFTQSALRPLLYSFSVSIPGLLNMGEVTEDIALRTESLLSWNLD